MGEHHEKKIYSVLIALIVLFSFVPATLLAVGDNSGSDIDNAFAVTDLDELLLALDDPDITVIELVDLIVNTNSIIVPDGKTLIIRDVGEDPTVLCQLGSRFTVDSGATLINEGSLVAPNTIAAIRVDGTFINRGRISQSIVFTYPGAEFINEAEGDIARRNLIYMRVGSTLENNGTLLCPIYYLNNAGAAPDVYRRPCGADRSGDLI